MNIDPTFIKNRYETLNKDTRVFLDSKVLVDSISEIVSKYNLHIDQAGILEKKILLTILGLERPEAWPRNLVHEALLDNTVAENIAKDVDANIFTKIRNILGGRTDNQIQNGSYTVSNRDSLLSAIENPVPTEHPISIGQEKPLEKTRPSSGDEVAHDFIGEKLTTPVSLPSQKTTLKDEQKKSTPTVDPYREAIN
jgi:hypothetical protein